MEDMMGIEIRPIDGHVFAREVIGAQLWRDFEPADLERIRVAWAEAGVVVFRRQALSEQELVNFSRRLGIPQIVHRRDWISPEHRKSFSYQTCTIGKGTTLAWLARAISNGTPINRTS